MIYVECSPDIELLRAVGVGRRRIRHAGGKGRVCRMLQRRGGAGMVDEDPESAQPGYMGEMKAVMEEHGIRLLRHNRTGAVLIVLMPRLEEWFLHGAREAGVRLSDYSLPGEAELLHERLVERRTRECLARVVRENLQRSPRFRKLHELMQAFKRLGTPLSSL